MTTIIRVSATSSPSDVAGCIANVFREQGGAAIRAIGPQAVNQAVKAIIQARRYLAEDGVEVAFIPTFENVNIDGLERTAVRLDIVSRRKHAVNCIENSRSAK